MRRWGALGLAIALAMATPLALLLASSSSCALDGLAGGPPIGAGGRAASSSSASSAAATASAAATGSGAAMTASSTTSSTGSGGAGGAGAPDGAADASPCPTGMFEVPDAGYCIDRHEATRFEYQAFVAKISDPNFFIDASLAAELCDAGGVTAMATDGVDDGRPARGLSWCDAYLYCQAMGKRLCGKIGGGPEDPALPDDLGDEWFHACSNGGTQQYPWGGDGGEPLDLDRCDDCTGDAGCDAGTSIVSCPQFATKPKDDDLCANGARLADVGSFPACELGDSGVTDLIGSVWEWEDSCDDAGLDDGGGVLVHDPAKDRCWRRGGAWTYPDIANMKDQRDVACLACAGCVAGSLPGQMARAAKALDNGIRCCADVAKTP